MFKINLRVFQVLSILALLLSSCSNTRFLADDQVLYTGLKKVKVEDKDHIKSVKPASEAIEAITFFKPNNALFRARRVLPPIGLWTHNYLKSSKKGKEGGWFYRNFGKEPILISTVNPELRSQQLQNALFGYGFFNVNVSYKINVKKSNPRKAKIEYSVQSGNPFYINKILTIPPADSVDIFINDYVENFQLKPGDVFNLEFIKSAKRNMAALLVEMGYYYFSPDDIDFIADTTVMKYQIDLMIRKKSETPAYVIRKYTINNITVNFTDASSTAAYSEVNKDSLFYEGVSILGSNNYIEPDAIVHCIQFESGDLYSTSRHQGTVKQLNNYGVFKNVKVQFVPSDTLQQKLNMIVELSPKENVSINLEGFVQAKSTGFAGPGMEVILAHGNIGRKANRLQLKLNGVFEWQIANKSDENLGANSYNVGISSAFVFPRFVLPFNIKGEKNLLASKTITDVGFEFLNNVRYYRMTSLTAGYSYQWKRRQKITNTFSPIKINMVNLLQTTTEFDSIVESNIYVKKSFEEQTILGMEYSFVFDNSNRKSNGTYIQAIVSTSGNLASLASYVGNAEQPYTILGNVYSQFLKGSVDFRYYTGSVKKGFAFRFYTGTGYSYGNSTVMPYIEQFYSGGSTSIRGFTARALGPGSYKPEELNGIIDQTGDIKMEFNVEYRVPFSPMVHGALFVDIGNVWLLNRDENRPGAEFDLNTFTRQLAVGSGLGLRFDFDFFILRTDLGLPLRNTYETEGSYWLENFSDVMSGYRFNIAIGYPF